MVPIRRERIPTPRNIARAEGSDLVGRDLSGVIASLFRFVDSVPSALKSMPNTSTQLDEKRRTPRLKVLLSTFKCRLLTSHSVLTTHYPLSSPNISFTSRRDGGRLHNWQRGGKK